MDMMYEYDVTSRNALVHFFFGEGKKKCIQCVDFLGREKSKAFNAFLFFVSFFRRVSVKATFRLPRGSPRWPGGPGYPEGPRGPGD